MQQVCDVNYIYLRQPQKVSMTKGSCWLSMIPVRSEPSSKSEMVNQLLFGDRVTIQDESRGWFKIASLHDSYEGWCESNQVETTTDVIPSTGMLVGDITAVFSSSQRTITLVYGSSVPGITDEFTYQNHTFKLTKGKIVEPHSYNGHNLLTAAMKFAGSPYLWGGRSPFGIDCSGLIQMAFKLTGINMPRDASEQANHPGDYIDLIGESEIGDIAFFDNEEGRIIHTGILTGDGSIVHASGRVRVDSVDHNGIFNKELGIYTHKLRVIKRFNS